MRTCMVNIVVGRGVCVFVCVCGVCVFVCVWCGCVCVFVCVCLCVCVVWLCVWCGTMQIHTNRFFLHRALNGLDSLLSIVQMPAGGLIWIGLVGVSLLNGVGYERLFLRKRDERKLS